mmetsp:Transcript_1037/g.1713  ORF Transcript_1037/g.1713 Transcript_1037/m.1713 type:complete len:305 (+) Transcript_1037:69-983(+)
MLASLALFSASMMRTVPIDSHLHVWSDGNVPFPYATGGVGGPPPADLAHCQAMHLLSEQQKANVGGALIVQPINHGFDHSYVESILSNPDIGTKFKGMCLIDPKLDIAKGKDFLSEMQSRGFVGVRFNPYLWPQDEKMSDVRGSTFYQKAGELNMPVGFMCFKGLPLHYDDIVTLLEAHPKTKAILDHWGFFLQNGDVDEIAWQQLLSLAKYPQVYVKTSALFRVSKEDWPYADLDSRFLALKSAFGAKRLMWGSDYPFVEQKCGYQKALSALAQWQQTDNNMLQEEWEFVLRKTAESLFGEWS